MKVELPALLYILQKWLCTWEHFESKHKDFLEKDKAHECLQLTFQENLEIFSQVHGNIF